VDSKPLELDVSGLSCPEPVLRVKKILNAGCGRLQITTDSRATIENIGRLAVQEGYTFSSKEQHGQFFLLLSRDE